MTDVTELLFKVSTQDDRGLERVDAAIKKIAASSGYTGKALEVVEGEVRKAFDDMAARGLNFEQILRRIGSDRANFGSMASGVKSVQQSLKDAADAADNLEKKQKSLQQAGSGLQNALTSPLQSLAATATNAAAALGPVGLAFTAIATVATLGTKALIEFYDSQAQAALQTQNMALKLGISSGQMKTLQIEAQIAGLNIQSLTQSARFLSVGLEDSSGSGKRVAQALKELGVSMQTSTGQVREEGAVFLETIEALSHVESQTKRTELGFQALGGRSAREVQVMIDKLGELKAAAAELGAGSVDELVNNLARGAEQVNKMSAAWDLFKSRLAEVIEPIVVPVVVAITKVLTPAEGPRKAFGVRDAMQPQYETTGARQSREQLEDFMLGARRRNDQAAAEYARQQTAADIAAGDQSIAAFNRQQAGTPEGRKQEIQRLTEEIKKLNDSLSKGGLGKAAADSYKGTISADEAKVQALEAENRSYSQRESLTRQLTEDKKYPGLQSPTEFLRLIAENQRARNILGPGGASLADSSPQYGSQKIADSIQKFFNQIAKSIDKGLADEQARQNAHSPFDLQYKAYQQQLKQNDEISKSDLDASLAQLKIVNDSDRGAAERQQSKAYQLAQLQLGGNNAASIGLSTQERIGSATNLYQQQSGDLQSLIDQISSQSDKTVDDYKELNRLATERVQMEATYYKEIDEARIEAQIKLAELQKQELDDYKKEAASIFDALREPGGLGMQKWIRSQGVDLARGLFSNATAPILQGIGRSVAGAIPGQQNPDGTPTFIGNLTKGTILDANRNGKTPQIIAVDANTKAINLNTAALTGRAAGGVPAPQAAPGSIAGAAASGVSNTAIGPDGLPLVSSAGTALAPLSIPSGSGASLGPLSKMFSGGSTGGGQFLDGVVGSLGSAKGGLFGGGLFAGLNPDAGMTGSFRAGNIIGSAAEIGTGIYESVNQFNKGGAQGIIGGVSAATLTAGQLAGGNSNPVGMTLDAIGGILGLIKSLFPNSADTRAASIANQTSYSQYLAPPTINQSLSSSGGYQTYTDKTGLPQVSQFNKIAETNPYLYLSPIQQPGSLYQNFAVNPGAVYTPGVNTPAPTPTYAQTPYGSPQIYQVVNVNAIDTQTGTQFLQKNMETIATGMASQIRNGHPVGLAVQQALIGT